MGLDMYLMGNKFLWSNWENPEECPRKRIAKALPEVKGEVEEIIVQVGYWRKANAVHKWFVDNVQEGVDNCGSYEVTKNHLITLQEACNNALAGLTEHMPTQGGFFFGSTEYDDYYMGDLRHTLTVIQDGFEFLSKHGTLSYRSSW